MPKKNRDILIRHAEQAQNNLDRYIDTMGKMHEFYHPSHPEHAVRCLDLAKAADALKKVTQRFRDEMM